MVCLIGSIPNCRRLDSCKFTSNKVGIISEVWIDGESLADMLKAKGLAKDYDGEGARPEW